MEAPYTTCDPSETPRRRVVDLSPLGFPEIPALGASRAAATSDGVEFHRHRGCMEITLCTRGSVKFDCEGKVYSLLPGRVFASMPGDAHRMRTNPKGAHLDWIFFRVPADGESVLGLGADESRSLARRLLSLPRRAAPASQELAGAFAALFAARDDAVRGGAGDGAAADAAYSTLRIRAAALRLLMLVAEGGEPPGAEPDAAFTSLVERMRRNPEADFGAARLAEETGLSPNTVLSRFRAATGLPPHAFLMKCRVHKAMELLSRGGRSIADIAQSLGFASSQHLSTRFRQETGKTPRQWRLAARTRP